MLRNSVTHEIKTSHAQERDLIDELQVNQVFDFGCAVELVLFTLLIVLFNHLTGQKGKTQMLIENLFDLRSNLYHRYSKYGMVIVSAKLFFMFYQLLLGNSIKTMWVESTVQMDLRVRLGTNRPSPSPG